MNTPERTSAEYWHDVLGAAWGDLTGTVDP